MRIPTPGGQTGAQFIVGEPGFAGSHSGSAPLPRQTALPCRGCPRGTRQISDESMNVRFYSLKSWERLWRMANAMTNSKKRRERWDWSDWMVTLGKERGFPRIPTTLADEDMFWKTPTKCRRQCRRTFVSSSVPPPPPWNPAIRSVVALVRCRSNMPSHGLPSRHDHRQSPNNLVLTSLNRQRLPTECSPARSFVAVFPERKERKDWPKAAPKVPSARWRWAR